MQNVQVPVWVAIVITLGVAIIGALGPIAAQFVNAWRETRRETVKWEREREARDRAKEVELFGRIQVGLDKAEHAISRFRDLDGESPDDVGVQVNGRVVTYGQMFRNVITEVSGDLSEVLLFCSKEAQGFMGDGLRNLIELRSSVFSDETGSHPVITDSHWNAFERFRAEFLEQARKEIGVTR